MTGSTSHPLPTRTFGRHDDEISIVGLGGGHAATEGLGDAESLRIVRAALDAGITFVDTAWCYGGNVETGHGYSETIVGRAIDGRRDEVFLMSKVCRRDAAGALEQLEDSLRRLGTDYLDLWQLHEVNYDNDPEWIFEPGGAIEAVLKARAQGKVRYIGFTGHKSPHIHKRMLAMDFEWDACQMPIGVFDSLYRSFEREVLPELSRRGIACIGMKSVGGGGQFITEGGLTAEELRRYALSQPISVLSCGQTSIQQVEQDVNIARSFTPMPENEQEALRNRVRRIAGDGRLEWYKSTTLFDHPYHQSLHGFPKQAAAR